MAFRLFGAVALAVGLAACAAPRPVHFDGTPLPQTAAPAISLTDQRGSPWTLSAQRGKTVALFFGYTHCTDVCPATLAALTHAVSTLPAPHKVEIVFVTVDPARDRPPVMARYLRQFELAPTVGLTGTRAQLQPVWSAYHVWSQKLPGTPSTYEMAHNGSVYLIDPAGNLRVLHEWNDPESGFVHDLQQLEG